MLVVFLGFLRTCFGVPDVKVRVTCNLFADHADRQYEIGDFGSTYSGCPGRA